MRSTGTPRLATIQAIEAAARSEPVLVDSRIDDPDGCGDVHEDAQSLAGIVEKFLDEVATCPSRRASSLCGADHRPE